MKFTLLILLFVFSSPKINGQERKVSTQKKIIVAQDGSGDFSTIQTAINAVNAEKVSVLIFIKKGIYKEKIIIPLLEQNLTLVGEDENNTIITHDDYSGKVNPNSGGNFRTSDSYTLLVQANDVTIENLTIENSWCEKGQAVSLHVKGNRFLIRDSKILGCQDTLLTDGEGTMQYYENCYIDGTTDFIFGPAIAIFKDCTINSKKDSYITAVSTPQNQEFGYVFLNCNLIADTNVNKVFLGRPWRPYAKTVFIECNLGSHILPEGWNPWKDARFGDKTKTAYYAEYKNKGKGAVIKERVAWSFQLYKEEARKYTLKNTFKEYKNWNALNKN